jgi:hypothetical protein
VHQNPLPKQPSVLHSDAAAAITRVPTPPEFAFDGGRAPFHILTAAWGDKTSALARCTKTTTRRMETEHRAVSVAEGRPGSASDCAEVRVLALLALRRLQQPAVRYVPARGAGTLQALLDTTTSP